MATYKQIFGKQVKFLSADPPSSVGEGQIWYNSTSQTFKSSINLGATWASAPTLGTARYQLGGAGASNTSAVVFGGYNPPAGYTNTENYDGSSWTASGALPVQKRGMGTAGTQTTALSSAGFRGAPPPYVVNTTEEYDGSSWTAAPVVGTARGFNGGCGTQTAALLIGGATDVPAWVLDLVNVEEYNGTAWTAATSLPIKQRQTRVVGTTSAAAGGGGLDSPGTGVVAPLSYDGSSWTAAPALNVLRYGGAASGVQTSVLVFGGGTPPGPQVANTELYDGSSWATDATLGNVIFNNASSISAPSSNTLSAGGGAPATNRTEVYSKPTIEVQTITTS